MPLFKNLTEIKQYVTISNANSTASMPPLVSAEEEYIIPVIGQDLYDLLQAQVDADVITQPDLLDKVRQALGSLAYYKALPLIHTHITDAGLRNVTTEKIQGAYRYQYEDVRQHLENEGIAALERLYVFLQKNSGDYPEWTASEAYIRLNKNLIKTGAEFSKYFYLWQPNRTFFALQPVMQEVEDLFLMEVMTRGFLDALNATASPSILEAEAIDALKRAVANFTIYKSISKLSVKVRPEGFTVLLATSDRSPSGEQNAAGNQLELLYSSTYKDGNAYLQRALDLLNLNASDTVFPLFFSSSFYVDPSKDVEDINDTMDGLYAF